MIDVHVVFHAQNVLELIQKAPPAAHNSRQPGSGTSSLNTMSTWLPKAPRLLDEAEALCAVLLAVAFAHGVGAHHTGWAAFSGYMVMRSRLSVSLPRGIRRVVGTVEGASLAWCMAVNLPHMAWLQSVVITLVGGVAIVGMVVLQVVRWLIRALRTGYTRWQPNSIKSSHQQDGSTTE